ncbi:aminotransferase class V-fold PLP-dependent enzyme [Streptomyces sp. NPDC051956]|uniref:aminotransferase class V-fold PLP-dependent enzyme n=1 Tax=Streptomyces sp. NPDC051956 TaxID=3365677 RepID=UPI0037CD6A5F
MSAQKRVHLNTAGAAVPLPAAVEAFTQFTLLEAELGPYEAEERYAGQLGEDVYAAVGRLLGAPAGTIALFASATDAWCRTVCNLRLSRGSRIWVTPYEYAGNLIALRLLADRLGCRIEVVPTLPDGDLDLDWMRRELDERVALVSVVHIPSGCGIVLPVAEIGAILTGSDAVYVVDACQSVGHLPLDVAQIGCDILTGAGRKFLRGPRGSGFAYVARSLWDRIELPFYDLHVADVDASGAFRLECATAARFETAERSGAAVLGLLAAAEHAHERAHAADSEVFDALTGAVRRAPGVQLLAPGSTHSGIVSFVHADVPAERIRAFLANEGVHVWVGTGSHTPLYHAARGVDRFVRASVHYYNDLGDIDRFGRALATALADH